jgi:predicted dehydrogenase
MILAKCCHDLDIMVWNLGQNISHVGSFGSLSNYQSGRAPAGAPARCLDGCPVESTCAWSAKRIYLDLEPFPHLRDIVAKDEPLPNVWPFNVLSTDTSYASRLAAVQNGPYGRCVYQCDNDVVDHQVVTMEFAHGVTASLTMHGMGYEEDRTMRYDGTLGTLTGVFNAQGGRIEIHPHRGTPEVYEVDGRAGHGGGDTGIMKNFVAAIRDGGTPRSTAQESLESHLLAFASEDARISRDVIDMAQYRAQLRATVEGLNQ